MSDIAIRVSNVGKRFELGELGTASDFYRKSRRLARRLLKPGRNGHDPSRPWEHETDPNAFWALKGIDFEVREGEVLGIIGHNGAGKSTLLKVLSRITAPTTGRIDVYGRVASLLEVGTGFHPELTGRENIYLNGSILGMTRQEISSKLDEIVDFAGVERFLDTPVKRYSSGMKVRLGFAVAAHLEPEILVVDEVLAVGDAAFQQKCLDKMHSIAAGAGRVVLFVSHNMGSIQTLCTRAILLSEGAASFEGEPTDVVSRYLSEVAREANVAIADRTERLGNGLTRIVGIEINGQNIDTGAPIVRAGGEMLITFHLSIPVVHAHGAFSIWTAEGERVAMFDGRMNSNRDTAASAVQKITCQIPELLLVPGEYRLSAAVRDGAVTLDNLQTATRFSVQDGVVRGFRVDGRHRGVVIIPHSWLHDYEALV